MSRSQFYRWECLCGRRLEVELWDTVNATNDPELKAAVLDGTLNVLRCPGCSTSYYASNPLLYHDMDRNAMIWMYPVSARGEEQALRAEIEAVSVPLPVAGICPRPRLVFGMTELIEAVRELDSRPEAVRPPDRETASRERGAPGKRSRCRLLAFVIAGVLLTLAATVFALSGLARKPKWVTVSYAGLLEPNAIVRTGESLKSALGHDSQKGAVQPFVDRYSYLLEHALEMLNGPDRVPHSSVVEQFAPGSRQPAWVAIFRGGRIHLTFDGRSHVRAFLPDSDPQGAYSKHYSAIRHCLNGLVPSRGQPLSVDVFAYSNNYANSRLRLNTTPYHVSATRFPSKGVPLNLAGLAKFFNDGPTLEGAQLKRSKGLILYGKTGDPPVLAGHAVSLADFAVAYRAAVHAGDNAAFISLDPHLDPTKVTVNFGGFLEDTHIGSVVLAADKRFKTITSGLDPDSFSDIRDYTRAHVPSFMTLTERDLQSGDFSTQGKWIGTRFWFYPDETGVDTDLNHEYAAVVHPRFTADAERSREDFASRDEFERKKAATLMPSIRCNIDHLNQNYAQYASAFAEINDLATVARLMGIASWLKKANARWLDLDALLAVELPAHSTDREKGQLMATALLACSPDNRSNPDYVKAHVKIAYLSPVLDSTVRETFPTAERFAKYLCLARGRSRDEHAIYLDEAAGFLAEHSADKVRTIIKQKRDLRALAEHAAGSLDIARSPQLKSLESSIDRDEKTIEQLKAEINRVKGQMAAASRSRYDELVDEHNALVQEARDVLRRHNANVDAYNRLDVRTGQVTEIGGGINLEPEHFRIRTAPDSPRLIEFRDVARSLGERPAGGPGGRWMRSSAQATTAEPKVVNLSRTAWTVDVGQGSPESARVYAAAPTGEKAWVASQKRTGSWRELVRKSPGRYSERSYQAAAKTLHVAEFEAGRAIDHVVGKRMSKDSIIFTRAEAGGLMAPQEPPIWWLRNP